MSKADPRALALADRHYTRQQPGTPSFTRPGYNHVLLHERPEGCAVWCWWRPKWEAGVERKDALRCLECTIFRNETRILSSELVRTAVEALGAPEARHDLHGIVAPPDGLVTAVGSAPTARRRSKKHLPGHCYRVAGWVPMEHRLGRNDVWLRYAGALPRPVGHDMQQETVPWASTST